MNWDDKLAITIFFVALAWAINSWNTDLMKEMKKCNSNSREESNPTQHMKDN